MCWNIFKSNIFLQTSTVQKCNDSKDVWQFLGTLSFLQIARENSSLYMCMKQLGNCRTDFHEHFTFGRFTEICQHTQILVKIRQKYRTTFLQLLRHSWHLVDKWQLFEFHIYKVPLLLPDGLISSLVHELSANQQPVSYFDYYVTI